MGMNLSGGYAAGSGADMLYKIVEQAAEREQERKRNALAEEELRQRAKDRAAEQDYRTKSLASLDSDRKERQAAAAAEEQRRIAADTAAAENQAESRFQGRVKLIPKGTLLQGGDVEDFQKRAPSLIESQTTGRTPGPLGLPGGIPTGKLRFIGTQSEQDTEAKLKSAQEIADARNEAANARTAAAIAARPNPRDRYQIQPDGKGGLVRVDLDTNRADPVQMGGGSAVQVKGTGATTPAGIQQQQTTATNVRKHLEDVGKEAAILDQMGLMGPVGSRWADFMAGRIGAGELAAGDPQKAQLLGEFRADVKLLQSGMAMVHGGARGGSSPGMASRMESIINADRMDLPLFQGALSSFDKWLAGYEKPGPAQMPKMAPEPGHTPTGGPKAGGSKDGAVTVMDPQGGSHTFPNQAAADAFKKAAGIR